MAKVRNKVKSLCDYDYSDFSLLIDSDITFTTKDLSTMIDLIDQYDSISMVTPFGHVYNKTYKYYDTYALETLDGKHRLPVIGCPSLIEVNSAFGGIFVMRTNDFKKCDWDPKQVEKKAEHYSFCKKAKELGKIVILTNVKVCWNKYK